MSIRYLVLLFIAAIIGLSSCKNNDEVLPKVVITNINVVNASTDTLNFYLNGTRQNNLSGLFPAGASLYLPVPAGQQNYQFKKAGGFTYLFSLPLNLKDSSYYSLYVYGESASQTFTNQDVLLTDTLHPDTTMIRFINVSPDAGSLNLTLINTLNLTSNNIISFIAEPFKGSTQFVETPGGQEEVKVFQAGATIPKVDTTITFQQGASYTIFSKGLISGKGNAAFGIGIIMNVN
jgi:hypothetical protein